MGSLSRMTVQRCCFLLGLVLVLSACKTVSRNPGDFPLPAPIDASGIDWEAYAAEVLSIENQIPRREAYIIGPGDVLSLQLIGRPDLLGLDAESEVGFVIEVSESPVVTLPYVGPVTVHGKTAPEIESDIREAYAGFVKDPAPVLTITRFNDNSFSVIGSIASPGRYQLEVGDTVLEAIFKAGGLQLGRGLPPARTMKIYRNKLTKRERFTLDPAELLTRLSEDGSVLTRREIVLPLDEFILGGDLTWNIPVQQNDIIYIPPAGTVSVHGNVKNPRVVFLGPGLRTVVQVLTEVGGMEFSAKSTLEVVRQNPDGTVDSFYIHGRQALRRQVPDFYLQDNDQIFVYKSHTRTVFDFIGNLFRGTVTTGVNATYSPATGGF